MNELGLRPWASQPAGPDVELRKPLVSLLLDRIQPLPCGVGGRLSNAENLLFQGGHFNFDREVKLCRELRRQEPLWTCAHSAGDLQGYSVSTLVPRFARFSSVTISFSLS